MVTRSISGFFGTGSQSVLCPEGRTAIGGGAQVTGGGSDSQNKFLGSFPVEGGWAGAVSSVNGISFSVYAVCAYVN